MTRAQAKRLILPMLKNHAAAWFIRRVQHFNVMPAFGYWELNGKPVSAKAADYGLAPGAEWKPTEASVVGHLHGMEKL